ncbi:phosphoribosyltransferase [Limobrevibacterium gyesilva]|uniref:Phosphoribosyltransferase n=1 Tax=Limobrevibacterium gyesilva TaxID=2991712 RepID=A0AA42CFM3_9PROT|nr:phosphoribosyltransferase [Limobrevibacterium gyesilva]MCW3476809.1 phosphoribosyltransferase [Limobrevibacterium gyesilva]
MQYWQDFLPPSDRPAPAVWSGFFDATMPDGTRLRLPLRDLGDAAVAGMIANQASFPVLDRISHWMAGQARRFAPEVVVGLPTLGHVYGATVARALGHANWVAPGTSRKLWYDAALSVPLVSITSPMAGRRMWLDPRLLPRLQGRRVLLVDDVISTGSSSLAGLALLRAAGVEPVALCVAMAQGNRWQAGWPDSVPVAAAFATPLFARAGGDWVARAETAVQNCCPPIAPATG